MAGALFAYLYHRINWYNTSCGGWEVAKMWDEEGGDGEDRVVSSEPDLVGPIPGQGVQVVHEHRLLSCPSSSTCEVDGVSSRFEN